MRQRKGRASSVSLSVCVGVRVCVYTGRSHVNKGNKRKHLHTTCSLDQTQTKPKSNQTKPNAYEFFMNANEM